MRRRLKGYARFFPGCLYGALIEGFVIGLLSVFIIVKGDMEKRVWIIFYAAIIASSFISMKIGKLIFTGTCHLIGKIFKIPDAERRAKLVEAIVFLAALGITCFLLFKL